MLNRTVFVGGIHGVGKTSMCAPAATATGALHLTASALIKGARAEAIASSSKRAHDVPGNQALLVEQFRRVLSRGEPYPKVLLDGHYTVLNKHGVPDPIATEVFSGLGITSLVCIRDEPEEIANRLGTRDGTDGPVAAVAFHQQAELAHAESVASALRIPLVVIGAFDEASLIRALAEAYAGG